MRLNKYLKSSEKAAKWTSQKELEDECTMLYIKYGLHVIPIKAKDWKYNLSDKLSESEKEELKDWRNLPEKEKIGLIRNKKIEPIEGEAICNKLIDLNKKWKEWWKGIVLKPKFRKFEIDREDPYFHYEFRIKENQRINTFDDNLHKELDKSLGFTKTDEEINKIELAEKNDKSKKHKNKLNANKDNNTNENNDTKGSKKLEDYFAKNLSVVVGDGGTGKSWSVQHYLKKKSNKDYKIFFWSSYYANDVLTGIDRLIEFFIDPKLVRGSLKNKIKELSESLAGSHRNNASHKKLESKLRKLKNFKKILDNEDTSKYDKFEFLKLILDIYENGIIVFDGIEKLLKPNKENTEGESVNPEVRKFFKIITNKQVESRIIITTRLFPSDIFYNLEEVINSQDDYQEKSELLDIKNEIKKEKILSAPKCWSEQLEKASENAKKTGTKVYLEINNVYMTAFSDREKFYSYFCSLFDGHVFAISIMKGILEDIKDDENKTKSLLTNIVNTPVELRVNRVIQEAIANLDRKSENPNSELYKQFIEQISLFMHPIRKEVAEICFEKVVNSSQSNIMVEKLLTNLYDKNLVQIVEIKKEDYYVVHPLIRSYIFETLHESRFTSLPGLQLPGVTSSKEVVDPGNERGIEVCLSLFTALCNKAQDKAKEAKNIKDTKRSDKKFLIASDMCRASFSILRSRFCTNTIVRWGNHTDYIRNLLLIRWRLHRRRPRRAARGDRAGPP